MPFPPADLSDHLKTGLEDFARTNDFRELYRGYSWDEDIWCNGFPSILELEATLTATARENVVTKEDILSVVKWGGGARRVSRIQCPETLHLPLWDNGEPHSEIEKNPLAPVKKLQARTKQLGPTSLSKVLRFALPSEYGAIDTRIVRVVGTGDDASKRQQWLDLKARDDGYGWYIPKAQGTWPGEYATWIDILRFFAAHLSEQGTECPHPPAFVDHGLRTRGVWYCADVEMALWTYASTRLNETKTA